MKIKASLLSAVVAGFIGSPVNAQLFEVSTSTEFQSALTVAASNNQNDTIVLAPGSYMPTIAGQVFSFSSTDGNDLRIEAETPGQVVLDGQSATSILYLSNEASGTSPSYAIKGIRFENGNAGTVSRRGGALTALNASLQLEDTEFVGNVSDACGAVSSDSTLEGSITDSVFRSNRASRGGALCTRSTLLTITGSEFSSNEASDEGGAILGLDGRIRLESSVVANNRADRAGAIAGMAIEVKNSIVADNTASRRSIVSTTQELRAENSLFEGNQVPNGVEGGIVRCEQTCVVVNSVFASNIGAPSVTMQSGNADQLVVANSVFLNSNSASFAFADTTSRATILNNFIASSLLPLPEARIVQQDNILDQSQPALDSDYQPLQGASLIDAGTSEAQLVRLPETDALGNPRIAGANVDIGWVEFGSSPTAPIISDLSLDTVGASNLDSLSFSFQVELAEGRALAATELWTDEEPAYRLISHEGGVFGGVVFVNGGAHQVKVRVTDSAGERSQAAYSFTLNSLSTEGVALKVEEQIRAACAEDMAYCGIDVESFVAQAIEEAKLACKSDPASCQIEAGSFNAGVISSMSPGNWHLYGTGRDITDLATVFAEARVVWFHNGRNWEAFSTQADVVSLLNAKGIPTISKIPAGRGFWVKK